jgi:hypothetical protein
MIEENSKYSSQCLKSLLRKGSITGALCKHVLCLNFVLAFENEYYNFTVFNV